MPRKVHFEWEASVYFRRDSAAQKIQFTGFAICDGDVVAVAHEIESGETMHYLSAAKVGKTGEVAHTVGMCRD